MINQIWNETRASRGPAGFANLGGPHPFPRSAARLRFLQSNQPTQNHTLMKTHAAILLASLVMTANAATPLPNLRPHRPTTWSAPLEARVTATSIAVSAGVKNAGQAAISREITVKFYLNGDYVAQWRLPSLGKGSERTREFELPIALDDGSHTLEMRIDTANAVRESNEGDNKYRVEFTIEDDSFAFKLPLEGGRDWRCTQAAGGPTHGNYNNQYYSLDFWRSSYSATANIPVYAIHGGKIEAGYSSANGNYVRIDDDEDGSFNTGLSTVYLHLRDTPLVRTGDIIGAGRRIGYMGKTGNVQGQDPTHLHITFRFDGDSRYRNDQLEQITIEGIKIRDFGYQWYPSTR